MNQEKMGKFIKKLREENNYTQKDIGDKLGISDNSVSKWERGINAPDIYYLQTLAELFQVTVKELLNGERNFKKKEIKSDIKVLEIKMYLQMLTGKFNKYLCCFYNEFYIELQNK